jgi:hypothetical protein
MHSAHQTPAVTIDSRSLRQIPVDLIVVPSFEDDALEGLSELDSATGGELGRARARGEFTGKLFELFYTPVAGMKASRVVLVGAGKCGELTTERLRRIATVAGLGATAAEDCHRDAAGHPR